MKTGSRSAENLNTLKGSVTSLLCRLTEKLQQREWLSRLALVVILGMGLSGCESLRFYAQAGAGQWSLIRAATPIDKLLEVPGLPSDLRLQLALVAKLRVFAETELGLPVGRQYSRYADLQRNSVVWNVFAAEPLALEPKVWCYPVAGCAAYRGYFDERAAIDYANNLALAGYDTYVAGVAAYSTLGWLNDPVLNTFIYREESQLADLIFHELAHQLLYVPGDTQFNESFATAVAMEGVRRWMLEQDNPAMYLRYLESRKRQDQFMNLIAQHRDRLGAIYDSAEQTDEKHQQKDRQITLLRSDFAKLQQQWGDQESYTAWISSPLNNAKLISVGLYFDLVPAFQQLLASQNNDLQEFYASAMHLGQLDKEGRRAQLGGDSH